MPWAVPAIVALPPLAMSHLSGRRGSRTDTPTRLRVYRAVPYDWLYDEKKKRYIICSGVPRVNFQEF